MLLIDIQGPFLTSSHNRYEYLSQGVYSVNSIAILYN